MSKILVNLENSSVQPSQSPNNSPSANPKKRSIFKTLLLIFGVLTLLTILIGAVGGYLYWRNLQQSPAYSLALLVDAVKRDDQKTVDQFIDSDALVDSFLPQVIEKATERYGRGLAPEIVTKTTTLIAPYVPKLKEITKQQLPRVLNEQMKNIPDVSPIIMAIGINQKLNIAYKQDMAEITGKINDRDINLTMKKNGDKWKLVGVKDEALADKFAEKIGQQIMQLLKDGFKNVEKKIGIDGLDNLIKNLKDIGQ